MKKAWIAALILLSAVLAPVAGLAQTPSPGALTPAALASILALPVGSAACPAPASAALPAAAPGQLKSLCTAVANCQSGTVSCSSNTSPNACSAADTNCPGEQGHVTCNGNTTWCQPACTTTCTTGGPRQKACCRCEQTGDCIDCEFCEQGFLTPGYCE